MRSLFWQKVVHFWDMVLIFIGHSFSVFSSCDLGFMTRYGGQWEGFHFNLSVLGSYLCLPHWLWGSAIVSLHRLLVSKHLAPSWYLPSVLDVILAPTFEPLEQVCKVTTVKVTLQTALLQSLTSAKRVDEMCVLSINQACTKFSSGIARVYNLTLPVCLRCWGDVHRWCPFMPSHSPCRSISSCICFVQCRWYTSTWIRLNTVGNMTSLLCLGQRTTWGNLSQSSGSLVGVIPLAYSYVGLQRLKGWCAHSTP